MSGAIYGRSEDEEWKAESEDFTVTFSSVTPQPDSQEVHRRRKILRAIFPRDFRRYFPTRAARSLAFDLKFKIADADMAISAARRAVRRHKQLIQRDCASARPFSSISRVNKRELRSAGTMGRSYLRFSSSQLVLPCVSHF